MPIKFKEKGTKSSLKSDYYVVTYYDNNGKLKNTTISCSTYGKYTLNIAEHLDKTGERLYNWIEEKDDYYIIILYSKKYDSYYECMVDKDDIECIKLYHWRPIFDTNEIYAEASYMDNKEKKNMLMHRLIMKDKLTENNKLVVDHIKGNGLNNRKENLRVVTSQENSKNRINIPKNNTTGYINITESKYSYRVRYTDENGNNKTKNFGFKKFGSKENALKEAINFKNLNK